MALSFCLLRRRVYAVYIGSFPEEERVFRLEAKLTMPGAVSGSATMALCRAEAKDTLSVVTTGVITNVSGWSLTRELECYAGGQMWLAIRSDFDIWQPEAQKFESVSSLAGIADVDGPLLAPLRFELQPSEEAPYLRWRTVWR